MPERLMIAEKLPVFGVLLGPVLALPSKFVIGQKMVGISMIRAHVLFGQGDQKEDFRILDDEPRVPDRLAKSKTERRRYRLASIAPPNL